MLLLARIEKPSACSENEFEKKGFEKKVSAEIDGGLHAGAESDLGSEFAVPAKLQRHRAARVCIHRVVLIDIYQPRAVPPSGRLSRLSTVSIESPPASSLSGHGRYRSDLGPSAMAGIDPI